MYVTFWNSSACNQLRHLYNFAGDHIYANRNASPEIQSIYDKLAIDLLSNSIKVNSLVLFSFFLCCCVPLYNIFFNDSVDNEYQLIIPVKLPFIDIETQSGFYINLVNQMFICLVGAIAIPTVDLVNCVILNSVRVSAALIANSLTHFKYLIETNEPYSDRNSTFRNIIVQITDFDRFDHNCFYQSKIMCIKKCLHQLFFRFISDFRRFFYWKLLIQPILLMYSIISSIFIYIMVSEQNYRLYISLGNV